MKPCVLAIGNFDGVHVGHRALLAQLQQKAALYGVGSMIYTFDPPTRSLIAGTQILSTRTEKAELLSMFCDRVHMVTFDEVFAARSDTAFLTELSEWQPLSIVVGDDFRFGKGRGGGIDELRLISPDVEVVQLKSDQHGELIKSTRIRELLSAGEVEAAAALLGRVYSARGLVVQGDQLGRTLGYPTANLKTDPLKALPVGTFSALVCGQMGWRMGMVYVGTRPTLHGQEKRFEVNLLDWEGDLYEQELEVHFYTKLRGESRFSGLDELKAQLAKDANDTRRILTAELKRKELKSHE